MKILFVSSGNSVYGISPIIKSQGKSLKNFGIHLDYFTIVGKGIKGYLKNIACLRKFDKSNNYDLIHSHFSLSSIVVSFSCRKPIVASLMGSDTYTNIFWKIIIKILYRFKWQRTIVKSERMKKNISLKNAIVIPNGVNFRLFKPIKKNIAKDKVRFSKKKRYIIFVANTERAEKNFKLAKKAFELINDESIILNIVTNVDQKLIPYYMNAADVLLLTSLWEGSPNVIKEGMACNLPIVTTDVGDVKEVIGNTKGCYICSYDPLNVANKLKKAINFGRRTNGRENIKRLDSSVVAKKIIRLYEDVLNPT